MNMKYSLIAPALVMLLPLVATAPAQAQQQRPSYTYAELGYVRYNTDPAVDGYGLNGSFAFGTNWHLFGGFSDLDARRRFDEEDGLLDTLRPSVDIWNIGVGYNHELSPTMDLVARVAYERLRLGNFGVFGGTDDGYFAEVGVRSMFTDALEGHAFVGWRGVNVDGLDLGDWSGDFYGRLGGVWHFTPAWGLVGDVTISGGDRLFFVGPRLSF
jgi:Ax21 family sulfation-dependent quorum factor